GDLGDASDGHLEGRALDRLDAVELDAEEESALVDPGPEMRLERDLFLALVDGHTKAEALWHGDAGLHVRLGGVDQRDVAIVETFLRAEARGLDGGEVTHELEDRGLVGNDNLADVLFEEGEKLALLQCLFVDGVPGLEGFRVLKMPARGVLAAGDV